VSCLYSNQSSILNESFGIILSCISFLGLILLYVGAITTTYYILLCMTGISTMKWSDLRSNPSAVMTTALPEKDVLDVYYSLAGINGIFLTVIMLYTAWGAGSGFLGSLWHGLGVGATVAGFLLMSELVALSIGTCWTRVGSGRQEDVEMRTHTLPTSKYQPGPKSPVGV